MSNQGTLHLTVIAEAVFDNAPTSEQRNALEQNGVRRNGKTWKKVASLPGQRLSEDDLVKKILQMTGGTSA